VSEFVRGGVTKVPDFDPFLVKVFQIVAKFPPALESEHEKAT
jgi:hypothetical protein